MLLSKAIDVSNIFCCVFLAYLAKVIVRDWLMDGWMTWGFTYFSTVFQSYEDNDQVIIKGCMQGNPIYGCKDFHLMHGSNQGPLDQ